MTDPAAGPLALYLHLPFCLRKCAYCDFASSVPRPGEIAAYLHALRRELELRAPQVAGRRVETVYLGGGTPTLVPVHELAQVLEAVRERFDLDPEAEVNCEANPGTVDEAYLRSLREAGVNRLSLGVQSFREDELRLLGRMHTADQARAAVSAARAAGFGNLSLDLIAGLPGQSVAQWEESLAEAVKLAPEHLSCYGLALHEETPLGRRVECGELSLPAEETAEALWLRTHALLTAAGYEHYEVSNYAQPGRQCRHNLTYWRNREYLGLGLSAASYLGGRRWVNTRELGEYCRLLQVGRSVEAQSESLPPGQALGETVMLGLRMAEGVSPAELAARFGPEPVERLLPVAQAMRAAGLLKPGEERWQPTQRGMLLNNRLALAFVEALEGL